MNLNLNAMAMHRSAICALGGQSEFPYIAHIAAAATAGDSGGSGSGAGGG